MLLTLINEGHGGNKQDTIKKKRTNLYKLQQNTLKHRNSHTIGLLSPKSDDSVSFFYYSENVFVFIPPPTLTPLCCVPGIVNFFRLLI